MRGDVATLPDIVLDALVLPANLVSDESLSPDVEPEEERYRIDTYCYYCTARLRISVVASLLAIGRLQQLLLTELHLICPGCSRNNGRST